MGLKLRRDCALFIGLCCLLSSGVDALAESREPIRVGVGPATSQQILAHVTAQALMKAGYKVDFIELEPGTDDAAQVDMIASGSVHVHPSLAAADAEAELNDALAANRVISLGNLIKSDADASTLKVASAITNRSWPGAVKVLRTMAFPPEDLDRMAQNVEAGRSTVDRVVDEWMKGNPSSWKRWITASRNWMTP